MIYVLKKYNNYEDYFTGGDGDEVESGEVVWETDKEFSGEIEVCDILHSFVDFGVDTYVIPEGVTTIKNSFFIVDEDDFDEDEENLFPQKLVLPASVSEIGSDAIGNRIQDITVDPANKHFMTKDGALFSIDGKRLLYVMIPDEEVEEYVVPDGVEEIDESVIEEEELESIVIPDSVKKIGDPSFGGPLIKASKGSYAIEFAKTHKRLEYEEI